MSDIIIVMKFTMKDMLHRKSFILSTIIILMMIIIGFNIPNAINAFNSDENQTSRLIISDKNNVFENKLNLLDGESLGFDIITTIDSMNEIKEKILNDEAESGIIIERKDNIIKMTYVVENAMFNDGPGELFTNSITSLYKSIQIEKLNLTEEEKALINPTFNYDIVQAGEEAKGNVLVMMLMSIVLFYAVYFCAYQVSSSITTEKTSKIIETLVTSTSPRNIVIGKTLGIGFVGLCQMILFLLTAVVSGKTFMDEALLSIVLDISSLTPTLAIITLLYFILGYFTFALLYALTGSTVNKPEDIQSANTPVAIITIAGFYLSYFTMMNPTSNLNKLAALIPISSPFCMPFRIMMGLSSNNEILLSVLILIVTILLVAHFTIKIYSNAILNYGTKMSLNDIIKMYKQR